ncbi:MAG: hypothetical protein E6J90_29015 [Deltaproteobacteria bacterium]|nr:MAG: hypothetical protein E6J91_53270 [Deltaproteobacteria bacterium]TMQ13211.1 MAG: hypothetical protein E6J90_29015 [Deltaproteobacteria bacterium]
MRANLVMLVLCLAAAPVAADSRTRELAKGYDRELAACQTRVNGLTKVVTGTQSLIDDGQKQYEADLTALRAGLAQLQAYSAELTATLEILNADPNAAYRSLERKLDEQDNKIRKLRQTSKKLSDELAPVTSRMIPVINARVGTAAPVTRRVHIKFSSGRAIDAPVLTGTYRAAGSETVDIVEYDEAKASVTITTKLVPNMTCEQQRQAIAPRDATGIAATDATTPLGLAWYIAYAKPERKLRVACRPSKAGALVATLDEPAASALPDFEPVLIAMIAARS